MTNRSIAVNHLHSYWYPNSGISDDFASVVIPQLDKGTFLSDLGAALIPIRVDKIRAAYTQLGQKYAGRIPPKTEFFSSVAAEVSGFSWDTVEQGLGDTAKDVTKVAAIAAGGYVMFLIAGVALLFLPEILGKMDSHA